MTTNTPTPPANAQDKAMEIALELATMFFIEAPRGRYTPPRDIADIIRPHLAPPPAPAMDVVGKITDAIEKYLGCKDASKPLPRAMDQRPCITKVAGTLRLIAKKFPHTEAASDCCACDLLASAWWLEGLLKTLEEVQTILASAPATAPAGQLPGKQLETCQCGHTLYAHRDDRTGACVMGGCGCNYYRTSTPHPQPTTNADATTAPASQPAASERDAGKMGGIENDDAVMNAPVVMGLKAQGHLSTIERMFRQHKSWEQIGKAIGWDGHTACNHYAWHLLQERDIVQRKADLADRLPFCPDHRDKVAGKECRECEVAKLRGALDRVIDKANAYITTGKCTCNPEFGRCDRCRLLDALLYACKVHGGKWEQPQSAIARASQADAKQDPPPAPQRTNGL
jgi:hypothetical protein